MNTPKTYLRGTKVEWILILSMVLFFIVYEKSDLVLFTVDNALIYTVSALVLAIIFFIAAVPILMLVSPRKEEQDTVQK